VDGLTPSDIAEVEELLGAYALDALEPDEDRRVEAHLVTCPRCRQEVAALREVAGQLGAVGQEAPPGVWDKIAASLPAAPPVVALDPSSMDRASIENPPHDVAPVIPIGSARRRQRRFLGPLVGLVAAVVIAVLGVQVVHLNNRVNNEQTPSVSSVGAALSSPGAEQAALTPASGGATLARVVIQSDGTGYIYDMSMPALASDRTYELWGVVDNHRVAYDVLGADPSGVTKFRTKGGQAETLAITSEPGGGVTTSSQPPVVLGPISPV
jgi:anti-sigma factor RsiW